MINAYLKDVVTIVRHGARDQYGTEGATTSELAKGFIQWKTRLVLNLQGEQVLSSASVLMGYDATLTHEDKILVGGVEHVILAIELIRDLAVRGMRVFIQ